MRVFAARPPVFQQKVLVALLIKNSVHLLPRHRLTIHQVGVGLHYLLERLTVER